MACQAVPRWCPKMKIPTVRSGAPAEISRFCFLKTYENALLKGKGPGFTEPCSLNQFKLEDEGIQGYWIPLSQP